MKGKVTYEKNYFEVVIELSSLPNNYEINSFNSISVDGELYALHQILSVSKTHAKLMVTKIFE